jgi:tripartite ATP-independent transporter DctM subunit
MLNLIPLFLLLAVFGVPLAYSIGIMVWIYFLQLDIPPIIIVIRMAAQQISYPLVAIPLFICAANIMAKGGMTDRLIDWCVAALGWIRGGIAQVNILMSIIFAGISGAALADVASIGQWLIPAMEKRGYKAEYAAAVTVASSTVSPIIPPSISLIVAGIIAETSIVELFMAGILPGLLMGLFLMILAYFIAVKKKHPKEIQSFSIKYFLEKTKVAILDLVLPILIIGGIRFGWYTATEGAAVALAYALFITGLIYKVLTWGKIVDAVASTVKLSSAVIFMVSMSASLSYIITLERIPEKMVAFISSLGAPYWALILIIMGVLLTVGMVMDGLSALIIFLPVILPLATLLHMPNLNHLIHFVHLSLVLGVLTPPVGVCLFLASGISGVDILRIAKATLPFLIVLIFALLLVAFIPGLTTWLPSFI